MSADGVSAEDLEQAITERLQATHVSINDVSGGCGSAYEVIIVAEGFKGKSKLQRHRLVFKELKEEIAQIHAFTQRDFTPEEWEELNS